MRFLEISIQNFLSFGPKQTLPLSHRGLVAVFGQNRDAAAADSNGAGKSSLLEALVWSLWGKTVRKYTGDDVINNRVNKDCEVSLKIEDDDGRIWDISRSRAINAKRANDLQIKCNGNDIRQPGITIDTQETISTLLGMDRKTFLHAVLMSYGDKPFSELTDSEIKTVLDDILRMDKLAKSRAAVSRRIKDKQNQLAVANTELKALGHSRSALDERLASLTASRDNFESIMQTKRMELLKRKANLELDIEKEYQGAGLYKLLGSLQDIDEAIQKLRDQDEGINQKLLRATRLAAEHRMKLVSQKAVLDSKRKEYNVDCHNFNNMVGKPCPTCKRAFDPNEVEELLAVWDDAIKGVDEKLLHLVSDIEEINRMESASVEEMEGMRRNIRVDANRLNGQRVMVQQQVQQRTAALNAVCQLEQSIFNVSEEIDNLDIEGNPYTQLVVGANAELHTLIHNTTRLRYKKRSLDLEIQHLLFWEHGFSNQGLKSYVIEGVLPYLTERAQHYADIISGGDMEIRFSAQKTLENKSVKEEFQILVENSQGASIYEGNSDGEKRRANISISWAFGDLAKSRAKKSIRFKGLDEPFENLDETGEDMVVKLLNSVLQEYETILCITHSDYLRSQFPVTLTVCKEGGFTKIAA